MRSTIAFGAIALAVFAAAEVTGEHPQPADSDSFARTDRPPVTVVSTVVAASCSAGECNAPTGTATALSALDIASAPTSYLALSVLLSALPSGYAITFTPSSYGGSPGASTQTQTAEAIDSSYSSSSSAESLPSSSTGAPPAYTSDSTVTVPTTSTIQSTETVPAPESSVTSPDATPETTEVPVPVTPASSSTEVAPVTGSESSTLETVTTAPTGTETTSATGTQSSNEVSPETGSSTTSGPTPASSTEAPAQQTDNAADMKKPSFVGLAAIMAALIYV